VAFAHNDLGLLALLLGNRPWDSGLIAPAASHEIVADLLLSMTAGPAQPRRHNLAKM
jgi:hypothetical protein